jgi:diacylglycerol kinase family enzyme
MFSLPREGEALLETLIRGKTVRVDTGRAEFIGYDGLNTVRYFLNVAEAGLGGETVARVNRTSKFFGGFISFLWGTAVSILFYQGKKMRITIDGGPVREEKTTLLACGNGRCFGGGMRICPEADMTDGYFDITGVIATGRLTLLWNLLGVYRGSHLSLPQVWHCRGKKVVIESPERVLVNLDGEQPGTLRGEFTLLPGSLLLII